MISFAKTLERNAKIMTIVDNLPNELSKQFSINLSMVDLKPIMEKRLRDRAKIFNLKGFRRGKVPINKVYQIFGQKIEKEVVFQKAYEEFYRLIKKENIKIAGSPEFILKTQLPDNVQFQVNFEILPDIKLADLSSLKLICFKTVITDNEVERALDLLVKQHIKYIDISTTNQKDDIKSSIELNDYFAQLNDRVTVDFFGTIDGKKIDECSAENYMLILGQNQLLPEFTNELVGMRVGQQKDFSLIFPEGYPIHSLVGEKAQFHVSLNKLEKAIFPKIDSAFATMIGIKDGDCQKIQEEIRRNLISEAERWSDVLLKNQVMEKLHDAGSFTVPNILIMQEQQYLENLNKQKLQNVKQRTKNSITNSQFDESSSDVIRSRAERRVKLGLLLNYLVEKHGLQAKRNQVDNMIENMAKKFDDSSAVINLYNTNADKLKEVEALVIENNIVQFVCSQAQVIEKQISFEELTQLRV